MKQILASVSVTAGCLLGACSALGHEHVAAGAASPTQDAPLIFASEDDFGAETGYVFPLKPITGGPIAGYYTGPITFVALPATPDFGGPDPEAAALGTHIEIVFESVQGPALAKLVFWETIEGHPDATPTATFPVGLTDGTYRIPVSENAGESGADPYGHIHGRAFGVTHPGLYRVGFRFIDTSTNGTNGGLIHQPSESFQLNFQAGLTIASIENGDDGVQLTLATFAGSTYQLESAGTLTDPSAWRAVGEPVVGDDHLHTVTVPGGGGAGYFRVSAR
jgi:hypothetical protein